MPAGQPLFRDIQTPIVQAENLQQEYTVDIWENNQYSFFGKIKQREVLVFPESGIEKFRVTGISPELKLCPATRNIFWGLKFTRDGKVNIDKRPITVDIKVADGEESSCNNFSENVSTSIVSTSRLTPEIVPQQ